jgi:hypothetical protein
MVQVVNKNLLSEILRQYQPVGNDRTTNTVSMPENESGDKARIDSSPSSWRRWIGHVSRSTGTTHGMYMENG